MEKSKDGRFLKIFKKSDRPKKREPVEPIGPVIRQGGASPGMTGG